MSSPSEGLKDDSEIIGEAREGRGTEGSAVGGRGWITGGLQPPNKRQSLESRGEQAN